MTSLHLGLLINPIAGMGGAVALKGSDGIAIKKLAALRDRTTPTRSMERTERALRVLFESEPAVRITTCPGQLGEQVLRRLGIDHGLCGSDMAQQGNGEDSAKGALALHNEGVDLIVFAGGDGTARDLFDVLPDGSVVLGIPAGVKMHSGVFAISPEAAGELLVQLAKGGLVGLALREVRDIDEEACRRDVVRSRFYGEMLVPGEGGYLQHTKIGGRESTELVAADIAAWIVEQMEEGCTYLIGPGTTTAAVLMQLGLQGTLLGVDVVRDGALLAADATEQQLLDLLADRPGGAKIIVTVIGGQGHVFGRGNQQLSPAVIRAIGMENIIIVAGKSKIAALEGRPLLADSNDPALDAALGGYRPVITGYQDQILYRLGPTDRL